MDDDDGLRRSGLRRVAHRVLNLELAAANNKEDTLSPFRKLGSVQESHR